MWSQAIWEKNNKNVGSINTILSNPPLKKWTGWKKKGKLPGNKKSIPIEAMQKKGKYNFIDADVTGLFE